MYAKPDKTGFVPNQRLSWIGTKWLHYKRNSAVYIVVGFSWDGVTDLWNVLLQRDGDPAFFNRMIADFTDIIQSGLPGTCVVHRFQPHFEYESPTTEHGCKQHPLQPSALCELCESNRRYLHGVGRAGIIEE